MYYIHAPTQFASSLVSGIFAFLAPPASSPEPNRQCNKPHNPADEQKILTDLFSYDGVYTFRSDFKNEPRLGEGDSLYNDFSYDHRFLITGKWYFRTGFEYERYDFGGTDNGLPDHLQAIYGHLAIEYVVKDHRWRQPRDRSWRLFSKSHHGRCLRYSMEAFRFLPAQKRQNFRCHWLGRSAVSGPNCRSGWRFDLAFSDNLRLEGVFPKPALVYDLNDDWQFRIAANLAYESFRTDDVFTPLHKLREHNAVVQYHETRAGLQVSYSGIKHLKITAAAGCTIVRDFDFFRVGVSERTDPAPYVQLSADLRF